MFKPYQSGHPAGPPKGVIHRKTILNNLLFNSEIEDLDLKGRNMPVFGNAKGKTIYEMMVLAMSIKAMAGDVMAFNALNAALGSQEPPGDPKNYIVIYKPEKVDIEAFNALGERQRQRITEVIEGETLGDMESAAGPANLSPPSS